MQLCMKSEKITILFNHPFFYQSVISNMCEKLVWISSNFFFQSVISDPPYFTIANPIGVSNFWHAASCQNYWLDIGQNLLSIFELL